MTPSQIEYFLVAARCLNFTEAANKLFITQPALSRQISVIESELNMQLFIRDKKSLKLTPAAEVLLHELPAYKELYNKIIANAQLANQGFSGVLRIGILDGHKISNSLARTIDFFEKNYPNIQLIPERFSFSGLINGLYARDLDVIITLSFDINGRTDLFSKVIEKSQTYVVMKNTHLLSKVDNLALLDLKNERFISISPDDCEAGVNIFISDCRQSGFYPNIKYLPTLSSVMLWVEAGLGIAVLNKDNTLIHNTSLKFTKVEGLHETNVIMAWKQDNYKPAISFFTNHFGT